MIGTLSRDYRFTVSMLVSISLTIIGIIIHYHIPGDNIPEPTQTVLISFTVSVYAFAVGIIIEALYMRIKYRQIAGQYDGYRYRQDGEDKAYDDDYFTLADAIVSTAALTYVGGDNFTIELKDVSNKPDSPAWRGDLKMVSSNMADIAWWYVNPKSFENYVGFKRVVIIREHKKVRIVLFSNDEARFGRELLVKKGTE